MTHFKLYRLKADDGIINSVDVDALDDAEAIALAIEMNHLPIIEIWCGTRIVGRVPPDAAKCT